MPCCAASACWSASPNLEPAFLAPQRAPKRAPTAAAAPHFGANCAAVAVAGARHVAAPARRRLLPKARPSGWRRSGAAGTGTEPGRATGFARLAGGAPDAAHDAEDLLALARALNTPAPLDLRVNTLKAEPRRRGAPGRRRHRRHAAPTRRWPAPEDQAGLQKHPAFLDGSIEVQDEGSQLLGFLLAPKRGELVVDFCAGAGGKTLAWAR
jgi:hypothetical protein